MDMSGDSAYHYDPGDGVTDASCLHIVTTDNGRTTLAGPSIIFTALATSPE